MCGDSRAYGRVDRFGTVVLVSLAQMKTRLAVTSYWRSLPLQQQSILAESLISPASAHKGSPTR